MSAVPPCRFYKATFICGLFAHLIIVILGCSDASTTVQRVDVSGTVTLNGQPLSAGAIVFHCDSPTPDVDSAIAFGFVKDGVYAIDAHEGPTIGMARVEFRSKPLQRGEFEDAVDLAAKSTRPRPPQTTVVAIPEKYGEQSTLTVELTAGENRHDFQLD